MPDNLSFEQTIFVILITAVLTHWLPGIFGAINNWWMRNIRRVEVQAEANNDNASAEKSRAEAMSTMLDSMDRMTKMVREGEEKRLADRQVYNDEIAKRDQRILEQSGQLQEQTKQIQELAQRLSTLETIQDKYEAEKVARQRAEADYAAEHELRLDVQEEFAVAEDKWRLEKRNLEDQIEELRMQMKALEAKLSRLEKVHNSTVEIEAVKDDSNGNTDAG